MVNVVRIRSSMSVEEHLSRSRGGRKILAHEKAVEYDISQLLSFERGFAQHQLETRGDGDGRPSIAILVASWQRARDSFARVTRALPLDSLLRATVEAELAKRDEAMSRLQEQAKDQLYAKLVEEEAANG
jgi:hypothetical protein